MLRLALALALAVTVARVLTAALAPARLLLVRARESVARCLVFHSRTTFGDSFDGQLLQMEGRRPGEAPGRVSSSERVAGIEPALQPWRGRLRTTTTHPRSLCAYGRSVRGGSSYKRYRTSLPPQGSSHDLHVQSSESRCSSCPMSLDGRTASRRRESAAHNLRRKHLGVVPITSRGLSNNVVSPPVGATRLMPRGRA